MESAGGWRWKTSAELAYVRAAGDLEMKISQTAQTGPTADYLTAMGSENNFRAALGLKATRRNLSLGVSVNG